MRRVSYINTQGKAITFKEAENDFTAKIILTEVRKNSKDEEAQLVIANLKEALD